MAENAFIFVYQTICLINNKSYVGVHGTNNLNDGYIGCGVYSQKDANRNMLFHRAVRKYGYANFKRHILSFYDTYEEALEEEKFIVTKRWVKDKSNYNGAIGGRGNTTEWMCYEKKEEWKGNIKAAIKEWMDKGGREKLLAARKTAKKSRKFGKDNPMYGTEAPHLWREVIQMHQDGKFIELFKSVKAASKATGATKSSIVSCCTGVYSMANGFVFRYKEYTTEEEIKLINNVVLARNKIKKVRPIPTHLFKREYVEIVAKSKFKPIIQFDINGNKMSEYESIKSASEATKLGIGSISANLRGVIKLAGRKFIFKYKTECL